MHPLDLVSGMQANNNTLKRLYVIFFVPMWHIMTSLDTKATLETGQQGDPRGLFFVLTNKWRKIMKPPMAPAPHVNEAEYWREEL